MFDFPDERLASFEAPDTRLPLSPEVVLRFQSAILDYYRDFGRALPWRETRDPYHIFLSELMLQQTQTHRVEAKYRLFVERFPDFQALAAAPLRELLTLWQGLGYNRRAKSLKEAATIVSERYGGRLPADPRLLQELPGIGPYTAAALCAFAFGLPVPLVETNIRRVYLHYFFAEQGAVRDAELMPYVEATLERSDPRRWYSALMDFGVMLKGRVGNANLRSAHYVRQPRFEGSNRQIRGRLLALLSARDPGEGATLFEMATVLPFPQERVASSLERLAAEGLVVHEKGSYRLPDR